LLNNIFQPGNISNYVLLIVSRLLKHSKKITKLQLQNHLSKDTNLINSDEINPFYLTFIFITIQIQVLSETVIF